MRNIRCTLLDFQVCEMKNFPDRHVFIIPVLVEDVVVGEVVVDHFPLVPASWPIQRLVEELVDHHPNEVGVGRRSEESGHGECGLLLFESQPRFTVVIVVVIVIISEIDDAELEGYHLVGVRLHDNRIDGYPLAILQPCFSVALQTMRQLTCKVSHTHFQSSLGSGSILLG